MRLCSASHGPGTGGELQAKSSRNNTISLTTSPICDRNRRTAQFALASALAARIKMQAGWGIGSARRIPESQARVWCRWPGTARLCTCREWLVKVRLPQHPQIKISHGPGRATSNKCSAHCQSPHNRQNQLGRGAIPRLVSMYFTSQHHMQVWRKNVPIPIPTPAQSRRPEAKTIKNKRIPVQYWEYSSLRGVVSIPISSLDYFLDQGLPELFLQVEARPLEVVFLAGWFIVALVLSRELGNGSL